MRQISPDLLAKLNSNMQTPANNAQPRMSVQVSRARSAVVDSTYWTVETIRSKAGLGDISLAPRRLKPYGRPDRIYEVHVDNGIVKTTIREYPDLLSGGWVHQFDLGAGSAVALAFDGEWSLWRKKWRLKTYEKPWIMWVDASNILWAQHWDDASTLVQLATGVLKVKAMRGWKNKYYPERDQGIVVGYIKTDGFLYYRSYCQDLSGVQAWEMERAVSQINFQITNLNLFLLNDYRMGFVVQDTTNQIHWLITERNWAGMAVGVETINVALADVKVNYDLIEYIEPQHTETISTVISNVTALLLFARTDNTLTNLANAPIELIDENDEPYDDWGFKISLSLNYPTETPPTITVKDATTLTTFTIGSIVAESDTNFNVFIDETMHVNGINDVEGDIQITIEGITNEAGYDYDTIVQEFTPTNLKPSFIPVPEVEEVWNE